MNFARSCFNQCPQTLHSSAVDIGIVVAWDWNSIMISVAHCSPCSIGRIFFLKFTQVGRNCTLMQTGYTFTFVFVFWRMRVYVRNECTSIQWGMLTHAYMAKLFLKGNAHFTYTFRLFRANLKTSWIFFLRWFNFHLQPNEINLNSIAGFLQSYLIFSNKFFLFNL